MSVEAKCFLCGKGGNFSCQMCNSVQSCSKYHLSFHSKGDNCFPFQILEKPVIGRCVVANRDISAGEYLLYDSTTIYGPRNGGDESAITEGTFPSNLEAQTKLLNKRAKYEDFYTLTELLIHHEIESEMSINDSSNSASSPLKDLHNSSVKELQRCNDLLDINALSLPIQGYRGFFPIFSFLSHSCNNNCRHVVKNEGDTYEVRLYSQRGIRRGEDLTITYTNLLRPTYRRRSHLSNVWKFVCNCSRCADPSENGSYINAVKCPFCREGHLLPQKSSNYEVWYCTQCDKTVNQSDVEKMVDQLEGVLNDTPKDWVSIEDYLQSMKAYLHSHHYLQILAKRYLTQLLPLEDDFLRQRMSLVEELLHIFDILDSGKSASRGCTLYERGRTQLASGLIPEGISSLKEAKACLEVEDENQSPQGRIKRNIQEILKQI